MPRILIACLSMLCLIACSEEQADESYLQRAQSFIEESEYDSARIELKHALQRNASDAQARCLLGRLQFETGNMLDAQKELERAMALGCSPDAVLPVLAQSHLAQGNFEKVLELESAGLGPASYGHLVSLQGIALLFQGQPGQAKELVSLALEKAPGSVHAQLAQARIEALEGNSQQVIRITENVLELDPENDEAWRLQGHTHWRALHLPKARTAFSRAIEFSRLPIADYISRGLINIQMDDYSSAQRDAAALAEIAPHHPGSNYIGGLLLFRAQEYRDAITMLSLGEAAAGKYPLMLFYLAVAHVIDGDAKVAEDYARRFLGLMPHSIEGRRLLGVLYMQRGAIDEAESVLRPVLDYDANDLGALHIMANALLQDDRADLGMFTFDWIAKTYPDVVLADLPITDGLFNSRLALSAKDAVQQALKPLPRFPREDILMILALLKDNDRKGAVKAAQSYKWRDLKGVAPHNVLGNVQLAINNEQAARKMFQLVLKRKPADPSANLNLAKLERKARNMEREREHYETILRAHPNHLPTLLSLADLEGREGDNGSMVDQLRDAIDRHPESVEPRMVLARYYMDSGKPAKVESVFQSLQGLQKHSRKVRSLRYDAFLAQQRMDDAVALARQEYARNPTSETVMELVSLLRAARQPEGVVSVLKGWVDVSPADVSARMVLASELEPADKAGANEQYRGIIKHDPTNLVALKKLAWNTRNSDPAQALVYIRTAADLEPGQPEILDSLAVIAYLNGGYEEASVAIKAALKKSPTNPNMRYHAAMIDAGMGSIDKALAALKFMLAVDGVEFEERDEAVKLFEQLQEQ